MRVKLLRQYGNYQPGREVTIAWANVGRELIRQGIARAVEPCDLHLNPPEAKDAPDATSPEPVAETPAASPARPSPPAPIAPPTRSRRR